MIPGQLTRTPIRRRARRDPVDPRVALAVFKRDGGCIAPLLGGSAADCWGRLTIEHVKVELRIGRRAESILSRMVTLCQGHTEDGRKAGQQWNTTKANRALVRDYLEEVNTPDVLIKNLGKYGEVWE
jgi:hypothetical protein